MPARGTCADAIPGKSIIAAQSTTSRSRWFIGFSLDPGRRQEGSFEGGDRLDFDHDVRVREPPDLDWSRGRRSTMPSAAHKGLDGIMATSTLQGLSLRFDQACEVPRWTRTSPSVILVSPSSISA